MKILICGASGFVGSHIAAHLRGRGHQVIAAARSSAAASRRLPGFGWIECDFRHDDPARWLARLEGVDAVINCVGVLQDGLGDDSRKVHVQGAIALFEACERADLSRLIHISAAGADRDARSAYSDDKLAGEAALRERDLDWVILRPSLVIARNSYGGTSLLRAVAGLPWLSPVVGAGQDVRPIMMPDLCAAVEEHLAPDAAVRCTFDIGGSETISMGEIVTAYRRWLGFGASRIWSVPTWLARPAFWFGDGLGWLGIRTSMRSNALRQLDFDVAGDPEPWLAQTSVTPQTLQDFLDQSPSGVADKWQARLGFARPLARFLLGVFWLLSGIIALSFGYDAARAHLIAGGFAPGLALGTLWGTAGLDILLGAAMLVKWRVRLIAALMILVSLAYLAAITLSLPLLWADPLGPVVKVIPGIALAIMIAATEDER